MAAAGAPRRRHPLRSASAVARNCTATPSLSVTLSLLTFHSKGASKSAAKLVWRWVTLALGHSRSKRCALHTASGTSTARWLSRLLLDVAELVSIASSASPAAAQAFPDEHWQLLRPLSEAG